MRQVLLLIVGLAFLGLFGESLLVLNGPLTSQRHQSQLLIVHHLRPSIDEAVGSCGSCVACPWPLKLLSKSGHSESQGFLNTKARVNGQAVIDILRVSPSQNGFCECLHKRDSVKRAAFTKGIL